MEVQEGRERRKTWVCRRWQSTSYVGWNNDKATQPTETLVFQQDWTYDLKGNGAKQASVFSSATQEVRKEEEHIESGGASQNRPQGRATAEEAASAVCEELRKTQIKPPFWENCWRKRVGGGSRTLQWSLKGRGYSLCGVGFTVQGAVLLTDVSSTIAAPLLASSLLVFTKEKP